MLTSLAHFLIGGGKPVGKAELTSPVHVQRGGQWRVENLTTVSDKKGNKFYLVEGELVRAGQPVVVR